jgi:hypothetical protein
LATRGGVAMILIDFPESLMSDVNFYAEREDTDFDSFILWAVAEKVGELKYKLIEDLLKPPRKIPPSPIVDSKNEYF